MQSLENPWFFHGLFPVFVSRLLCKSKMLQVPGSLLTTANTLSHLTLPSHQVNAFAYLCFTGEKAQTLGCRIEGSGAPTQTDGSCGCHTGPWTGKWAESFTAKKDLPSFEPMQKRAPEEPAACALNSCWKASLAGGGYFRWLSPLKRELSGKGVL